VLGFLEKRPWIALVVALVVQAIAFFVGQRDLAAADPLWYATNADTLATDPAQYFGWHDNHPFVMRLGLTGPLALIYRLFGVSLLSTNLLCLCSAALLLFVIYAAAETPREKLIAMALATGAAPFLVRDAAMLNPDLPGAAVMALSILLLARRRLVGAMAVWFTAFMIKETALWCALVWLYALVRDRREGRPLVRTYAPAIAVGAALGLAYLIFCDVYWGSPLARFKGIQALEHTWSMEGQSASAWLARLTWEPARLLWQMFGVVIVPAVLAIWLAPASRRIWVVAAWLFVAMYWFGSTNLTHYSPLPIMFRMAYPLVPGVLIAAALATDALITRGHGKVAIAILVLCVAPHVLKLAKMRGSRPEATAFARVVGEARASRAPLQLVCGDPRCTSLAAFYFGFDVPANVTVSEAGTFKPVAGARVRVLVQADRAIEYATKVDKRAEALALPVLFRAGNVTLYDGEDGTRLAAALSRTD